MKLGSIFDVEKPKTTVKNHFEYDANGINFVSSGEKNNGVVDKVKENEEYPIYPPGVITVPLKGTVLHANLQQDYFYCAHQIAILSPKKEFKDLDDRQKLFYALAIRQNKYKFNYNRQADRTLEDIVLPDPSHIPEWIYNSSNLASKKKNILNLKSEYRNRELSSHEVPLEKLFEVVYGVNLEQNKLTPSESGINFVSRTEKNNGVSGRVSLLSTVESQKPPAITVAAGGSVGSAFLQIEEFYSGRDLYVLYPKIEMTIAEMLFYCNCIRLNSYRFNYNRQANKTLGKILVPDLGAINKNFTNILNNTIDKNLKLFEL